MTKVTDVARPSSPSLTRGVSDAASDASLSWRDEHPLGVLTARRYRERVDVEISNASERGARWWSRRLVQFYENAGLVSLDK
jgi:hypothetical protein